MLTVVYNSNSSPEKPKATLKRIPLHKDENFLRILDERLIRENNLRILNEQKENNKPSEVPAQRA